MQGQPSTTLPRTRRSDPGQISPAFRTPTPFAAPLSQEVPSWDPRMSKKHASSCCGRTNAGIEPTARAQHQPAVATQDVQDKWPQPKNVVHVVLMHQSTHGAITKEATHTVLYTHSSAHRYCTETKTSLLAFRIYQLLSPHTVANFLLVLQCSNMTLQQLPAYKLVKA